MAREKVGEMCGIDLIIDDDVPEGCAILHDHKEAMLIKDGTATKVVLREEWARESRIAGRGGKPYPTPNPGTDHGK